MTDDLRELPRHPLRGEDPSPRSYGPGVMLLQRSTFTLDRQAVISPADLEAWLLGPASKAISALEFTEGFACRLAQAGLGVERMNLNVGTLHPQLYGYSWHWSALDGMCDELQLGEETLSSDAYRKNPLFRVTEYGEAMRLTLPVTEAEAQSPLLQELAEAGFSEYVATPLSASGTRHNAVTLATRQDGGFTDAQHDTLMRLLEIFALHVERLIAHRIAENISHTYLGHEAGERVINGTIRRGSGLPIQAVVWSSDMRDFSKLSGQLDNRAVADVLNQYFSVLAEAVIRQGGDVLKFVGDGMLAVFPLADFPSPKLAAEAAARAAREAVADLHVLNQEMEKAENWWPLETGIGLHLGEVFFGNIGAPRRLDFTVIGEAVNIASRVEGLCKPLKRNILLSAQMASLLDGGTQSLGPQSLKGIQNVEELFALT